MYSSIVKYSPSKTYQTGMLIELTPGKGFIIMANTNVQTAANDREVSSSVQFLTVTAIFVALTYIFTAFINVRLPIAANGGLIPLHRCDHLWQENRSNRRWCRNGTV